MVEPTAQLVYTLINGTIAVALIVDRFVHRLIGNKSHEARILDLEEKFKGQHGKLNEIQLKIGGVSIRLAEYKERIKHMDESIDKLERRRETR